MGEGGGGGEYEDDIEKLETVCEMDEESGFNMKKYPVF